ncbi:hypothetical protein GCM10010435_70060 [Winogradskya consettensis]|uniref:Uncharacterized protein n=1 Tax=Winogradskya consettensis TaxID=113560 RepID=A0A919SNB6_9ACTN|nr:hypothetical protein Aco04nite_46050 [Actinoplanes consettensis]
MAVWAASAPVADVTVCTARPSTPASSRAERPANRREIVMVTSTVGRRFRRLPGGGPQGMASGQRSREAGTWGSTPDLREPRTGRNPSIDPQVSDVNASRYIQL